MKHLDLNIPDELQGEDDRQVKSYPCSPRDKRDLGTTTVQFELHFKKQKGRNLQRTIELMQTEYKFDNVYAESKPRRPFRSVLD
jgi:hypothetical protein